MRHELDKMMSLIKDYKTGYGGVTDSFMRKELEVFARDYYDEQCNVANVVGQSEQLVCDCGNKLTDKELYFGQCLQCDKSIGE